MYTGCLLTWLVVCNDDAQVRVISEGRTCLGFVRGFLQCNNEYNTIVSRFVCSISLEKYHLPKKLNFCGIIFVWVKLYDNDLIIADFGYFPNL